MRSDSFETIARSPMTDSEESWLGHVRSCRVSYKDLYVSLAHMGVHGLGTTLRAWTVVPLYADCLRVVNSQRTEVPPSKLHSKCNFIGMAAGGHAGSCYGSFHALSHG